MCNESLDKNGKNMYHLIRQKESVFMYKSVFIYNVWLLECTTANVSF